MNPQDIYTINSTGEIVWYLHPAGSALHCFENIDNDVYVLSVSEVSPY